MARLAVPSASASHQTPTRVARRNMVMLVVEVAPANTAKVIGFDTITKIDSDAASRLVAEGLRFAVRYVGLGDGGPHDLDGEELDVLASAGLGVMAVQYARTSGWDAETGRTDGQAAARLVLAAGFPAEATLWCDLEGAIPNAEVAISYANAWHEGATSGGIADPGVYIGAGAAPPLMASQLYNDLAFRRYWRSFSRVNEVEVRGYQMIQLFPGDQIVAGVRVDLDVVQSDYRGSRPRWAVSN
jgi:Domain of unknown function (DUF1906)